jgi:pimeloyl-ACP methyl ester carboxylesterase
MPLPRFSTTVRSLSHRTLRAGFAALGRVSPNLGAVAGERLFLSPPRHAAPAREREALADGEPFEVRVRGESVVGRRFGEGPTVLLVHGWGGRSGQLMPLVPALRRAGLAAAVFDGPGHGRSGGRLASVVHFTDAIAAISPLVKAVAAIAHSMGAASLARALSAGLPLEAAVFVGPPRAPGDWLRRFCDALALDAPVREAISRRLVARLGVGVDDLDVVRTAPAQRVPLLVVHDRADREVAWSEGAGIAAAWPGARLLTTEGLGHRRILRDDAVAAEAAEFLSAHLPRCACGRLALEPAGWCAGCALAAELFDRAGRGAGVARASGC